jgi:multiple sugar transport system substrate-binding protein
MRGRRHVWQRAGAALIGVAAVVAITASSTPAKTDGVTGTSKQAATTITLAHWNSSAVELSALRKTIAAFQKANPAIKVNEISLDPYPEGMLARFAARKPPDIFYVDSSVFPDWVSQGVLEPIGDDLAKAKWSINKFYPRLVAAFRYKGQLYGLPKDWSPLAMEMNTALTAKANVKPPQTWAQLKAAGQALKAAGQPPICLPVELARILPFMFQNNGGILDKSGKKAIVNTPANAGAVATYLGWIQSGIARTATQLGVGWCGEALGKEKASIVFEGNWVTSFMNDTYPNVKWTTHPMVHNRAHGNLGFDVSWSIAKDSKNKAAALTMFKFLEGPVGMKVWTGNVGYLPSRTDVKPPPGRAPFLKEAPYARPWQFAPGFSKVIDTANSEFTAAFEGKTTVKAALDSIQSAAETALRRGR